MEHRCNMGTVLVLHFILFMQHKNRPHIVKEPSPMLHPCLITFHKRLPCQRCPIRAEAFSILLLVS